MKIERITPLSPLFPEKLKKIPDPPKELYYMGSPPIPETTFLAVVGTRKVTPYGRQVTRQIVGDCVHRGVAVVSGLAIGVDGLAHTAALDNGGYTVAVLPCGLDHIYPASHHALARRILEQGGALISEYPPGTEPYPVNFIARNRLVSGLSDAVLITEAAEKSGTLHTANFALAQGKDVLAVPGNITSQLSSGTNQLIQTGAEIVLSSADILRNLNIQETTQDAGPLPANSLEASILTLLQSGVTDSALLLSRCGMEASVFNQTMTMLEINGKIVPLGAGHWGIK